MADDDVDFLDEPEQQPAAGDDDLLDTGGRRLPRLPRAVRIAGVVVVFALAVAVIAVAVVHRSGRHGNHDAAPGSRSGPGTAPPSGGQDPPFAPDDVTTPVAPLIADATSVSLGFGRVYAVRLRQLTSVPTDRDRSAGGPQRSVPVPDLTVADVAYYRVYVDETAQQVWLIAVGVDHATRAVVLDAVTLRRIAAVSLPARLTGAAVLGGTVYVSTSATVFALTARSTAGSTAVTPVPGAVGPIRGITADPQRGRLIVVSTTTAVHVGTRPGVRVAALRPDGRDHAVATLAVTGVRVGVAQGAIWLSGATTGTGTVVERLDVQTLRPFFVVRDLQVALGPGAGIVAQGTRVIWLSSTGSDSDSGGLWCLEAFTGEVSEHVGLVPVSIASQIMPAPPQSRSAEAYVVVGGVLSELNLEGCNG